MMFYNNLITVRVRASAVSRGQPERPFRREIRHSGREDNCPSLQKVLTRIKVFYLAASRKNVTVNKMENIRKLAHGQKALMALLTYARQSGWAVHRTSGGHLKFTKPGCRPVYTSSTPGDHRAVRNARALLRRSGDRDAGE